jgi:hypothetical protein
MGLQLQLQLVAVSVAAAWFCQPLVAAAPVYGELADQMMPVEDQQVITGGEHQQHPAGEFPAYCDPQPVPVQEAALFGRAVPHQAGLFRPDRVGGVPGGRDAAFQRCLVRIQTLMWPVVVGLLVAVQQRLQLNQGGGGGPGSQPLLQGLVAAFILPAGLWMPRPGGDRLNPPNAIRFFSANTIML